MDDDLHWLATAFTVANSARAACYLPQIAAVWRSHNGARDIALLTWSMWTVNNLLGAAYTGLVAQVPALALSFLASALACAVTIAITLVKRAEFRRRAQPDGIPPVGGGSSVGLPLSPMAPRMPDDLAARARDPRTAMLLMVGACACFVAANALVKVVGEAVPTGELLFIRGLLACSIVWGVAIATRATQRLREAMNPVVLARAAAEALGSTCFLASLAWLPLAHATAIDLCAPLVATLLARGLLRERVGPWRWAAIGIGLAGVLLIVRPGLAGFGAAALLCLLGTALHAVRDLLTRRVPVAVPSVLVAGSATLGLTLVAGSWSLAEGWRPVGGEALAWIAGSALCLCGGLLAVIASLRRAAVSSVAPLRYTSLPIALLLGLLVWGEVPDAWACLGMALVLAAGALAVRAAGALAVRAAGPGAADRPWRADPRRRSLNLNSGENS